jgi:hypothetical protein
VFHRRIHTPRKERFKSYQLRYASKTYSQYQITVKLLGSFRLTAGNRHLHRYCIFTELVSETVLQSLHYSTRRNLPDKELRYVLLICISLYSANSIFFKTSLKSDVWFLRILKIVIFSCDSSLQLTKQFYSCPFQINDHF